VLELNTLQLEPILSGQGIPQAPPLKSETIARLHHAKQIILSRIENWLYEQTSPWFRFFRS
jgi:hypothetical protein